MNLMSLASRGTLGVLVFLLSSTLASAATYYVRVDGNNNNAGTDNSAGGAWRNVDWAADRVSPGDVVRIQAGTYSEIVTPGRNGSSGAGNTITFVADGAAIVCGWTFSNNSYIRVVGLVVDSNAGCTARDRTIALGGTNNYLEFWHNTIRDGGDGFGMASITDRLNNSVIIGNTLTDLGTSRAFGFCATAIITHGSHSLLAYNNIGPVDCDAFGINGMYNRWQNNYLHDITEASGGHSDFFQFGSHPLGLSFNIIEANFQQGMGNTPDEHTAVLQNYDTGRCGSSPCPTPVTENLWRRNVFHNVSSGTLGIAYTNGIAGNAMTYNRMVHNTEAGINRMFPNSTYGTSWFNGVNYGFIRNNIAYEAWGSSANRNLQVYYVQGTLDIDYNLAYDPDAAPQSFAAPWTLQAHPRTQVNPHLVDYANDNFTLGASSGAIGTAGPLTTTTGSGTGTTFTVAAGTGGFFRGQDTGLTQYGGNLTAGDVITVGTDVVRVVSVAGDAVTVTPSFTWANGDPVYSGNDTTPDIGAFPYKPGGFSLLTTYQQSGSTVTVTPADPSIIRHVVCYEDGIPTTVDSAGPFSCTVGGGSLMVRVYPLYAGKTLFATATPGAPPQPPPVDPNPPSAPGNLRIIQ
jgi:hypothetical protein